MVIELDPAITGSDNARIRAVLAHALTEIRDVEVAGRRFLAVSGARDHIDAGRLRTCTGVLTVTSADTTAFFCRRAFRPEGTTGVRFGSRMLGGGGLLVIAGPCAVENIADLRTTARAVKAAGGHGFRAGAFKPRTSPYNFQGLGRPGIDMLREVADEIGLPIVSEVLDPCEIAYADGRVDLLQVGARQMTNQALLKHLGAARSPVLLKRGPWSRLEELVRAAEFVAVHGNPQIALCERGIQTFETETRNTFDISAVPALRTMTHLPIVADPSHAVGRRDLVVPMALAAALVGADALMIEVHTDPTRMVKPGDANQALVPAEFESLMRQLECVLAAVGRRLG